MNKDKYVAGFTWISTELLSKYFQIFTQYCYEVHVNAIVTFFKLKNISYLPTLYFNSQNKALSDENKITGLLQYYM